MSSRLAVNDHAGKLLAVANVTSNWTQLGIAGADITNATITITCDGRPIRLAVRADSIGHNGTATSILQIKEGATQIANVTFVSNGTMNVPLSYEHTLTPTVGTHAYKLTYTVLAAFTGTIGASATSPLSLSAYAA